MPHITTCAACGALYEATSEEAANEPARTCKGCHKDPYRGLMALSSPLAKTKRELLDRLLLARITGTDLLLTHEEILTLLAILPVERIR